MDSPRPDVKSIFGRALQYPTSTERDAFLLVACGGDLALRGEVEALLAAYERAGHFMAGAAQPETAGTAAHEPAEPEPLKRVGPYKLLQKLGEGGMGEVWMAEQQEPVRRRVALKLIKAGMDTAQVVARFEAERQALALMDHQNIARVLDAGATEAGRPYFAMELVHGVPITRYCDEARLTPRERVELFIPVCQAVQHAHTKGIIHRDLKPSNVLVTLYDGKPVPKVIDFGIAKAVDQSLTDRTMFTRYGAVIGTYEYMSPEQAEMSALGVDTRSDIYSLGVLLYELLTGTTPLEGERLRQVGFTDMLKMIKEEEPPRPSARLSSAGPPAAVAAARKTEPGQLAALLRGELDWVVMRCLEKDRTRRYETASALAADLHRYLADEPVEACPPSAAYRLRRFARKYRKGLAAVAAFVGLLLVGLVVSASLAVRMQGERNRAQHAEQRNRALAEQMWKERNQTQLALTRQVAERIDGELARFKANGVGLAALVTGQWEKRDVKLFAHWMGEVLKKEEQVFGLTLGFEHEAIQHQPDYCLYVLLGPAGEPRVEELHNRPRYRRYRELQWYKRAKEENRDLWGEPYFDDDGGNVWMVSYSARLLPGKELKGVLTVDLELGAFSRRLQGWLKGLIPEQKSYGFLVSEEGNYVSHPAYQPTVRDRVPRNVDEDYPGLKAHLHRAEIDSAEGFLDPQTKQPVNIVFARVRSAGWTFVMVIEQTAPR